MVRDSYLGSGERQLAVSGNALDHAAIRAGLQWWETASSQWQCLRPHDHQGRPSVVRDSYLGSGERQLAVSGNALDHAAIRAGLQWWETASSQWQCLRPHDHQGRPSVVRDSYLGSGERQLAVNGIALDHAAIRAGLQWWETASSQWQCLRPHDHQGRPSVVRDSYLGSGERQLAVSGNALDHAAIRAGLQWWETASSQWQCLRPHDHQGRPSVVRDSYLGSGERQLAVSGKALDHAAIRVGPQWWETATWVVVRDS